MTFDKVFKIMEEGIKKANPLFFLSTSFDVTPEKPIGTIGTGDDVYDTEADARAGDQEECPFPTALLPPPLASLVRHLAAEYRVPEALPACCLLGVTSAALGAGLDLKTHEFGETRGNLFLVVAAPSGTGKSRVYKAVMEPVYALHKSVIDVWQAGSRHKLKAEKMVTQKRIQTLRSLAAVAVGEDEVTSGRELASLIAHLEKIDSGMVSPQILCDDVTSERLAALLAANNEVMFSASSDASPIIDNVLGRHSRAGQPDAAIYIKSYTGDPVRVDRVTRGCIDLASPCLATLWLTQPHHLDRLCRVQSLADGGLLPRLMVCEVETEPRHNNRVLVHYGAEDCKLWHDLVTELFAAYHANSRSPRFFQATEKAEEVFHAYQRRVIDRRRGDLADANAYAARWIEWSLRLSVVLHAAKCGATAHTQPLSPETAEAAVKLAEWFVARQLEFLDVSRTEAARKKSERVLDVLKNRRHQAWPSNAVTARDVRRLRIASTPTEATTLLSQMQEQGKLSSKDLCPQNGGRTVRFYTLRD